MNEWPPQEPQKEAILSREQRRIELANLRKEKTSINNEHFSGIDPHFLNDSSLARNYLEGLLHDIDAKEDPQDIQDSLEVLKRRFLETSPITYQEIMERQNYTDVVNESNVVSVDSINKLYSEIYDLAQIGHEWTIEDITLHRDRLEKMVDCFDQIEYISHVGAEEEYKEAA